jgi:hypothetical protein
MTELQYQLSNGRWTECGNRTEEFINRAEAFINNHPNKYDLLGEYNSVQTRLDAGKRVATGTDWYNEIRYKPTPRPPVHVEMKKCDCGCTIPKTSVMWASLGSSCPDCYDNNY